MVLKLKPGLAATTPLYTSANQLIIALELFGMSWAIQKHFCSKFGFLFNLIFKDRPKYFQIGCNSHQNLWYGGWNFIVRGRKYQNLAW